MPTTSRCWTCRRRRLKCDGGVPRCLKCWGHGVECLGYNKPLTWVDGLAPRGPLRQRTLDNLQRHHQRKPPMPSPPDESPPRSLTDPLFQNFNKPSRFFVEYFSRRVCPTLVLKDDPENHYRATIPLIGSPMVASAIVTVAACHYIQGITGCPMAGLISSTSDPTSLRSPPSTNTHHFVMSRSALFNYYLQAKGQCLNLVSSALASDRTASDDQKLLVTVVLLTILDLFESGSGSWMLHLEGAKKLLASETARSIALDVPIGQLLHEVAVFQTIGSSLAKPGVLSSASTFTPSRKDVDSTITPLGCPADILAAIEIFASHRRFSSRFGASTADVRFLDDTLNHIRSYDISSWAKRMTLKKSVLSFNHLTHLGAIWRLAAEMYACCALLDQPDKHGIPLFSPSIDSLIAEYAFLEQDGDELIKCLIWPTFVVGAASTHRDTRPWVLKTLDRIWDAGHCANTQGAAQVLESLWERRDRAISSSGAFISPSSNPLHATADASKWDWLSELAQLKGSWLFV